MVRSDEDDSVPDPKRMTNEGIKRMRCRTAAHIVSIYSLHAIQYCAMRQYTRALHVKWPAAMLAYNCETAIGVGSKAWFYI